MHKLLAGILLALVPVIAKPAEPVVKPLPPIEGIMITPQQREALVKRDREQIEQLNKMSEYIEQLEDAINKQMSLSIKCS